MAIIMGPVLKFVGIEKTDAAEYWNVSALIITEEAVPPVLEYMTDGKTHRVSKSDAHDPESSLIELEKFEYNIKAFNTREAMTSRFRKDDAVTWHTYRYDFRIPRSDTEKAVTYRFTSGGQPALYAAFTDKHVRSNATVADFHFYVPGRQSELNYAFASCNGFSDPAAMRKIDDNNALWRFMQDRHESRTSEYKDDKITVAHVEPKAGGRHYHALLLGGDQVYADSIWHDIAWLKALNEKRKKEFKTYKLSAAEKADIEVFYTSLYIGRWATPAEPRGHCAHLFASIPIMAMWDDHDIVDGWGSYTDEENLADASITIFRAAYRTFALFQQHGLNSIPADTGFKQGYLAIGRDPQPVEPPPLSYTYKIDQTAILAIDTRTKRTRKRILDEEGWQEITDWLETAQKDTSIRNLIVMLSIPAMHASYDSVADLSGRIPNAKANELQDDMFDHWATREQKGERSRLIKKLFDFAKHNKGRVTIVSGDVHVAAAAVIRDKRGTGRYAGDEIYQLTSSGIVHPPPAWYELLLLETLFMPETEKISDDIIGTRATLGDGGPASLRSRNWLSLEFEAAKASQVRSTTMWVNWYGEGETDSPYMLPLESPTLT
jgi:hypothetical protein